MLVKVPAGEACAPIYYHNTRSDIPTPSRFSKDDGDTDILGAEKTEARGARAPGQVRRGECVLLGKGRVVAGSFGKLTCTAV